MADWPVAVGGSLQGLQSLLAILALLSQGEPAAPRTPPTALLQQLAMLRSLQQPQTRMNLSLKPGTMQMPAAPAGSPTPDPGMGAWPPTNETPLTPYPSDWSRGSGDDPLAAYIATWQKQMSPVMAP